MNLLKELGPLNKELNDLVSKNSWEPGYSATSMPKIEYDDMYVGIPIITTKDDVIDNALKNSSIENICGIKIILTTERYINKGDRIIGLVKGESLTGSIMICTVNNIQIIPKDTKTNSGTTISFILYIIYAVTIKYTRSGIAYPISFLIEVYGNIDGNKINDSSSDFLFIAWMQV